MQWSIYIENQYVCLEDNSITLNDEAQKIIFQWRWSL